MSLSHHRRPVSGRTAWPRVLYLTNQLPFPATSGGQVRESELLRRLGSEVVVDLVVITNEFSRDTSHHELALAHCETVTIVKSRPPDGHRSLPRRVWQYDSELLTPHLTQQLSTRRHAVVHCEGYFLTRHLPATLTTPLVLVEENIEWVLERRQDGEGGDSQTPSRWRTSRWLERAAWRRSSVTCTLSDEDAEFVRRDSPGLTVAVTPNGFDHLSLPGAAPIRRPARPTVTFVGNFCWEPSLRAANRLLRSVWPGVLSSVPDAELVLVGSGAGKDLVRLAERTPNVRLTGEVPRVRPYLDRTDVFVSPVQEGTGIKVKIAEALQAGCAIVATPESLYGFPGDPSMAVLRASSDEELSRAVVTTLRHPALRTQLSRAARTYSLTLPTWDSAAARLLDVWRHTSSRVLQGG